MLVTAYLVATRLTVAGELGAWQASVATLPLGGRADGAQRPGCRAAPLVGGGGLPVAVINGQARAPAAGATWGTVKRLYE